MGDLSAHFSRHEFDSHDGARATPKPSLIRALEHLRTELGDRPIRIVSGYRSPAHNRAVHGAPRSRHLFNDAADLEHELRVTVEQAHAAGFTGIGVRSDGTVSHVDTRPGRPVLFADEGRY